MEGEAHSRVRASQRVCVPIVPPGALLLDHPQQAQARAELPARQRQHAWEG